MNTKELIASELASVIDSLPSPPFHYQRLNAKLPK